MTRIARIVIPGTPHHVVQRGNRRQNVFFSDADKKYYLMLLGKYAKKAGVKFWAFCLMDNHVHFIVVPENKKSLAQGFGEAHRRYSLKINSRENWKGYLWQGRFFSCPLEDRHLYSAIRYVERNPIRAGKVKMAEEYPWSSAKIHIQKESHFLLDPNSLLKDIPNWAMYLSIPTHKELQDLFRHHSRTGRPLGSDDFISHLEKKTGKLLRKRKSGPKSAIKVDVTLINDKMSS